MADSGASSGDLFFFHDGDSPIVFLGDDLTEQQRYSTLIETFLLTRYPGWKVTFRNAGWAGDTCALAKRGKFDDAVKRDVLALKPKVVVVQFGLNDAREGDDSYTNYLDDMTSLLKALEAGGARVVLLTPAPEEKYDVNATAGSAYNDSLKKILDGAKIVADNERIPLVDVFNPLIADIEAGRKAGVLSNAQPAPGPKAARLTSDGDAPTWGGALIMATTILQALQAPSEVSSVSIDATGHSILGSQNCQVELSQVPNTVLQFKRTDELIPWALPVDPSIDLAEKLPGFDPQTALNNYGLKIAGLKDGKYRLLIDDRDSGTYTSADLTKGVNLSAAAKGPIFDQCQELLKAVQDKNDAYFQRWRSVQLFVLPDWMAKNGTIISARDAELVRLDKVIADAEKSIDVLRQPTVHVFKLVVAH